MKSIEYGNLEIVKYLIEKIGVNMDVESVYGETPLLIAAKYG